MLRSLGVSSDTATPPDWPDRLDLILRAGSTPNGVFGAKVHWWQLADLLSAIEMVHGRTLPSYGAAPNGLRSFFRNLRYIWVRRENKVAQAISGYRAQNTKHWYEKVQSPKVEPRQRDDVPYDYTSIKKILAEYTRAEVGWRRFLCDAEDITFALTYEQLAADYANVVSSVLAFLGTPVAAAKVPPPAVQRQADARSLEWELRFREEDRLRESGRCQSA